MFSIRFIPGIFPFSKLPILSCKLRASAPLYVAHFSKITKSILGNVKFIVLSSSKIERLVFEAKLSVPMHTFSFANKFIFGNLFSMNKLDLGHKHQYAYFV